MEASPHNHREFLQESKESREGFDDLCIFTTTFYGTDNVSKVRQELALRLLKNSSELGIHSVVVDGGSNEPFLAHLRQIEGLDLLIDTSLKMGESRRKALEIAMSRRSISYFLWVEPEKDNLITQESLVAMIKGLRDDEVDIIVPRRLDKSSMPKFQAWIEDRANKRAIVKMKEKEVLDENFKEQPESQEKDFDLWFGPKMFNRTGAEFFSKYRSGLDKWDSIIKPVIEAYQAGKRIGSVDVDYKYDLTQSESERDDILMKKKRVTQYLDILEELGDSVEKEAFNKKIDQKKNNDGNE